MAYSTLYDRGQVDNFPTHTHAHSPFHQQKLTYLQSLKPTTVKPIRSLALLPPAVVTVDVLQRTSFSLASSLNWRGLWRWLLSLLRPISISKKSNTCLTSNYNNLTWMNSISTRLHYEWSVSIKQPSKCVDHFVINISSLTMYNRQLDDGDDDHHDGIAKEDEVARTFSIPDDTQVYTTDSKNHCYAFVSVISIPLQWRRKGGSNQIMYYSFRHTI